MALSQVLYVDKILVKFAMQDSAIRNRIQLSKIQFPKSPKGIEYMNRTPSTLAVGSLMYDMLCNRPDICHFVGVGSQNLFNLRIKTLNAANSIIQLKIPIPAVDLSLISSQLGFSSLCIFISTLQPPFVVSINSQLLPFVCICMLQFLPSSWPICGNYVRI
ncbi:uncharacterized protein LOC111400325 [Olea europaea var. sylvestris]|uniref:uncharacterized protein LOC111400325 n=1 Tax=Olea europaea var. sylvestris TaxID=158386 RepID=UPI000C1D1924|nr:uncharacterized protein LOC111400325 [Olea europaea var. sylvestris]